MTPKLHGIPEEILVGDLVETDLGVGRVTRISKPVRERDHAKLEVDLGRKWMNVDDVRSIVRHNPESPARREPEAGWDEHE